MVDGLYAVSFKTAHSEGTGVISVTNGSVNGGDFGYAYQGRFQENGQGMDATLSVWRFNPAAESVFGPADSFELEVSGPTSEKGFQLTGHVKDNPGHRIDITGQLLRPLV